VSGPEEFAFPGVRIENRGGTNMEYSVPGMTLRDYFAGQAMVVFVNSGIARAVDVALPELSTREAIATYAYAVADAMLEARSAQ